MSIRSSSLLISAACLFGSLSAGPAVAATTTACGPTVCYEYDNSQAALSLFSAPFVVGDQIIFTPTTFRAQSNDGVGLHSGTNTDQVNATFLFSRIYSISGAEIVSISVEESGDYEIVNDGSVDADLRTQLSNNNAPFQFNVATDGLGVTGDSAGQQEWDLMTVQLPADLFDGPANDVRLQIQNTLTAFSDAAGERAFIEKTLVIGTAVVPIPAAVWLFVSALGLVGWMSRRSA